MESTTSKSTLPEAVKTPNTPSKGTDLATVVDGGNAAIRRDGTPEQRVDVFFSLMQ